MADSPCPADSSSWCTIVENATHNDTLAKIADWVVAKPLAILILLILGVVVRWLLHRIIDRVVQKASKGSVSGVLPRGWMHQALLERNRAAKERRQQRAATMGSLLKSISTGLIATIVVFMVVAQLGYNIAPLIASAGIIGVALGFGAQSLVRDFISGIFMILEDQYGVGDQIDIGTALGEVEAVGLRVTRLRDVNGTVWYVRNGEITAVGNMSQNWARSVLDVQVSYSEDLSRVREILTSVAHQLAQDPEHQPDIIEEPEVWGVQSLDPDRVLVRVAIKTAPLKQWAVTRELRQRIKDRFDSEGIEIPLPQQVQWNRSTP
ncbi:MAG: mechanosensitive ion channel family protein [Nocardioidaceae bacterium]